MGSIMTVIIPSTTGRCNNINPLTSSNRIIIMRKYFARALLCAVGLRWGLTTAAQTFSDANWSPLGSGMWGPSPDGAAVSALAVSGGVLYSGGLFYTAGGTNASQIAQWNGSSWSPLGLGLNYPKVNALAATGGTLYVGGQFTRAGGTTANYGTEPIGPRWGRV
jgi:hypothetical protein